MPTRIEWVKNKDGSQGETWNPITGCSPISEGCQNCYARRMANRHRGRYGYPLERPFDVTEHPDKLDRPQHWRKPRRVFVCSMGDLFHEKVREQYIAAIFGAMALSPQHTFLVLTKRPDIMKVWFRWLHMQTYAPLVECYYYWSSKGRLNKLYYDSPTVDSLIQSIDTTWPLPNVHLGVTAENQHRANKRIPLLLQCPAAKRFVSCEPLLGSIDFSAWIKYNLVHEVKKSRNTGLHSGEVGLDRDKGGRVHLENCPKENQPMGRNRDREETSGPEEDRRISRGGVPTDFNNHRPGTGSLPSSSPSVASLQRSDSRRQANQSQKREKGGQQASEYGTCNTIGKYEACLADGPSGRTKRTKECIIKTKRYSGGANKDRICARTRNSGGNSQEIPCVPSDNIGHSEREETQDSTGNNFGLHRKTPKDSSDSRQQGSISLIIAGAETGPKKRPMDLDWARCIRDQCIEVGVPFFFKKSSDGSTTLDGKEWLQLS